MAETDLKNDFLKEMANIGIGHAATSLNRLVNEKVEISLPSMSFTNLNSAYLSQEKEVCSVSTAIQGEINGVLSIVFTSETCFWLIDKMLGNQEGTTKSFDEMGESAIKEFCNIVGGAFLTSLSNFLRYNFMPKIPNLLIGKGSQVKDRFSVLLNEEVKEMLTATTEFIINQKKINGEMHLILDKESLNKVFEKMIG